MKFYQILILSLLIGFNTYGNELKPGTLWNYNDYIMKGGSKITSFSEAPLLSKRVQAGELPPVEERLPNEPIVVIPWNKVGEYGGHVTWDEYTTGYDHYLRHILNIGLVYHDASEEMGYGSGIGTPSEIKPMVFKEMTPNDDYTQWTVSIHKGMKWSDGVQVTSEDIRFRLEDEQYNKELNPTIPGSVPYLNWGGEIGVDIIDKYSVLLKFNKPMPSLPRFMRLQGWPGHTWWAITPSHFMKKFHKNYTDINDIFGDMQKSGFSKKEDWASYYKSFWITTFADSGAYSNNPKRFDYPVLYPWIMKKGGADGNFTLERNPYFWLVDTNGNQLPYLDELKRRFIPDSELMNTDIIAGKVDVQGQFIKFEDMPLYKENEEKGHYNAIPVRAWQHHLLIAWLNIGCADEKVSAALSQLDFRKALSHAIDRNQVNETMFFGLAEVGQFAPPKGTMHYDDKLTNYAATYDVKEAKSLLAGLGYKDIDGDGFVENPDGSEFLFPLDFYEVTPTAVKGASLFTNYWKAIGINVLAKQYDGGVYWSDLMTHNKVCSAVWWSNGTDASDGAFIGMSISNPSWYNWYRKSVGLAGIWEETVAAKKPPSWAQRAMELHSKRQGVDANKMEELDSELWDLTVKNLHIIGTAENVKNPLILSKSLGNVEYGFNKDYLATTYWEWSWQWYHKDSDRR